MVRRKVDNKRSDVLYLALALTGLAAVNYYFPIISGPVMVVIVVASAVSLYLHTLQAKHSKKRFGLLLSILSAVYNPLALTGIIVLMDYYSMIWLLLFLVNMLRNPYLGFKPSVINGVVTVLCFNFLAIKIYHLKNFEIIFGSMIFFVAAVLAWVLTQKLWLFEQQSLRDGLTGLRNRRSFNLTLRQEIKRSLQAGRTISLLMIDLDNFKKYNDTLGHVMGDEILKRLASILTSNIRDGDLIFRYGGGEFCILLPGVSMARAKKVAERIREQVERDFINHEVPVTVSIGISSTEGDVSDARYLVELADKAMYRAKILKNRVVVI